jgi:hypothetical protein
MPLRKAGYPANRVPLDVDLKRNETPSGLKLAALEDGAHDGQEEEDHS